MHAAGSGEQFSNGSAAAATAPSGLSSDFAAGAVSGGGPEAEALAGLAQHVREAAEGAFFSLLREGLAQAPAPQVRCVEELYRPATKQEVIRVHKAR